MKALVYKSTGSWYQVKDEAGRNYAARVKGVLKISDISSTNPIAVGDTIEMEPEDPAGTQSVISHVYDRRNYVARVSPHNKRQHHIIASNLDQSILVATLREPRTSQGFIDRFLVTCEAFHIPAVIVFNKTDIYRKKEMDLLANYRDMYAGIGYHVHAMSLLAGEGIAGLRELLQAHTTLISGHSGVGKSSLLNALFPEMNLRTQEVSGWSGKGLHTTTFAEMFDLPSGGRIIDTPGVKEFGLVDIDRRELSHYFPEMRERLAGCQFNNCLHVNEPGCAVKAAVTTGTITAERYTSYLGMLDSIEQDQY
ncbi:MAG TPA: ribosome small subunit-dependent GTPase A [Sediminibacterium sp.]|nr:ribosome small subunit-dependent GTPase A [Sediminibacterium sp.]